MTRVTAISVFECRQPLNSLPLELLAMGHRKHGFRSDSRSNPKRRTCSCWAEEIERWAERTRKYWKGGISSVTPALEYTYIAVLSNRATKKYISDQVQKNQPRWRHFSYSGASPLDKNVGEIAPLQIIASVVKKKEKKRKFILLCVRDKPSVCGVGGIRQRVECVVAWASFPIFII